jgi:hypothetical protein
MVYQKGEEEEAELHIHKRKLSSEPHVKKRYKLGNHLFYTPGSALVMPEPMTALLFFYLSGNRQ